MNLDCHNDLVPRIPRRYGSHARNVHRFQHTRAVSAMLMLGIVACAAVFFWNVTR